MHAWGLPNSSLYSMQSYFNPRMLKSEGSERLCQERGTLVLRLRTGLGGHIGQPDYVVAVLGGKSSRGGEVI